MKSITLLQVESLKQFIDVSNNGMLSTVTTWQMTYSMFANKPQNKCGNSRQLRQRCIKTASIETRMEAEMTSTLVQYIR